MSNITKGRFEPGDSTSDDLQDRTDDLQDRTDDLQDRTDDLQDRTDENSRFAPV